MPIPERPSQVKLRLSYFLPINIFKMVFPIFRSTPALDVGKPVDLAICCLTFVIPNARFQEKLNPEMGVDFLSTIKDSWNCRFSEMSNYSFTITEWVIELIKWKNWRIIFFLTSQLIEPKLQIFALSSFSCQRNNMVQGERNFLKFPLCP